MKKILSTMLALVMLATIFTTVPFSAQAGKFPNTDLSITSLRADNGLPVGQTAKAPDAVFEVTCNDNNGAEWIVGSGSATYWATSSGTKLTNSDTISMGNIYKLQLCVYPDVVNTEEDEVDINEVKQITFNGVPLTTSQYKRGEFGNSIYLTINFCYVKFTNASNNKSGFYSVNQEVSATADNVANKHFVEWSGTYYVGSGVRSVPFADSTAKSTSFHVPYSSMPITVNATYEDHTPAPIDPVPATCTAAGKTSGVKCSVCGEILTAQKVIPATGHSFNSNSAKCLNNCGALNPNYNPKTIKFGGVTYTLQNGEYVATKAAKASVKKLVKAKKAFKVTYSKVADVKGYQVQYSTSNKFTKSTTKAALYIGNKKFTKTVSKLKANKKYYVRVRTYKTTKINGKTFKLYSSWSKAKSVTTKK